MLLKIRSLQERARSSLFLVPMVAVVAGLALASGTVAIDGRLDAVVDDLPFGLTSTVESARAILSTIAGATITVAAISFSVSLLVLQQASTQYSPRVVNTLFRDPFNKRVMGLVVGTFTYCLVVLRSVRSALEDGGEPVVPNISVAIAVVLGVATVLGIVAFIDHSAHSMEVSRLLDGVTRSSVEQIRREWVPAEHGRPDQEASPEVAGPVAFSIRFRADGWVQEIDLGAIAAAVPEGSDLRVTAVPGSYVVAGTVMAELSKAPDDADALSDAVCDAVAIGDTRTLRQDVSFGLRQLADVALRALSPGVNDPTTAQDAIFHSATVLTELLRRDPPPPPEVDGGGRVRVDRLDHARLIRLAYGETRRAAADDPVVSSYLLVAMGLVVEALDATGLGDRTAALHEEAALVLTGCRRADLLPEDLRLVEHTYSDTFR